MTWRSETGAGRSALRILTGEEIVNNSSEAQLLGISGAITHFRRGTIDMKDGDAALLEALIRLKREHFKPERDIIVAFTADEEAGGDSNGPAFLLKEHRNLIDAGLVVNLDGGGSSAFVARGPGESSATVRNVPSDGAERAVANGIGVFS